MGSDWPAFINFLFALRAFEQNIRIAERLAETSAEAIALRHEVAAFSREAREVARAAAREAEPCAAAPSQPAAPAWGGRWLVRAWRWSPSLSPLGGCGRGTGASARPLQR